MKKAVSGSCSHNQANSNETRLLWNPNLPVQLQTQQWDAGRLQADLLSVSLTHWKIKIKSALSCWRYKMFLWMSVCLCIIVLRGKRTRSALLTYERWISADAVNKTNTITFWGCISELWSFLWQACGLFACSFNCPATQWFLMPWKMLKPQTSFYCHFNDHTFV